MKYVISSALLLVTLGACSETPIEEQGKEAIVQLEKQIEGDAKSLEEAADEAVIALEAEIEDDLRAEGIGAPDRPQDSEDDTQTN